jgi:hypothetical protein
MRASWLVAEGEFDAAIGTLEACAAWLDAPAGVYAALVAAHALSGRTEGLRAWAQRCGEELGSDHPFSVASRAIVQAFAGECGAVRAALAGRLAGMRTEADADLLAMLMGIADVACRKDAAAREAALAGYRQLGRGDGQWMRQLEAFSRGASPR